VGILAVDVPAPAVEAAGELLRAPAAIHQPPAPVHAHVVEGFDRVGRGPHDDEGIAQDVVSHVVADVRDLLEAAGVLPDLGPEQIGLRPGVFGGNVRLRTERHRFGKILVRGRICFTHRVFPIISDGAPSAPLVEADDPRR
jgi:hypothetical protein